MQQTKLKMGVIGVGHLGKEHARILSGMSDVHLVGIFDCNRTQASQVAERCGCRAFESVSTLISEVDAVSVVVPTQFHHSVSLQAMEAGKALFIEKPLASNVADAREMRDTATEQNVPVQVGHIERFNPAYVAIEERAIRPKYIEGFRLAPFSGRGLDVGVVFDLMIHDLDIVLSLARSEVLSIDAIGASVLGVHEDLANVRIHFRNGCVASLTASRIHPMTVRNMNIFSAEGYAGLDFAKKTCSLIQPGSGLRHQTYSVRNLDTGTLANMKANFFASQFEATEVSPSLGCDQLTAELKSFVKMIRTGGSSKVSIQDGLAAVELAEKIVASIQGHRWEGSEGPQGPTYLPTPMGPLFTAEPQAMPKAA